MKCQVYLSGRILNVKLSSGPPSLTPSIAAIDLMAI